jgi:hypothetical protein
LGAGAVLMGAHDGAVDHRVLVVGIACEVLEDALPHTRVGPAAEAPMHLHTIAEAFGQVAPGNTGPVAVEHRLDEQPIIRRRDADPALLPRQQVLDSVPLVIVQAIAAHRSAPNRLTAYESENRPHRNPAQSPTTAFAADCGKPDSSGPPIQT